jgi:P-loop Domain of unknown function (DUF2791)
MGSLGRAEAESIIESLRFGVPPAGFVRRFTVGRSDELERLERSLHNLTTDRGAALLVKANYGAGKSHLLQVIREMALEAGYAVSLVQVNALEGVRFNRMDTIMGAVCARIEVPGGGGIGVGRLFDAFQNRATETVESRAVTCNGTWDYSDYLSAPGIYAGLRAWSNTGDQSARDLIEDWLANPEAFRSQRKLLYKALVEDLRSRFREARAEWQFYSDEVFWFHTGGHRNAWGALADLDLIARSAGLRGLVILFDEFEDVIQNLNRRNYQEEAFLNLFRFFAGERFPGMTYFAVTPDFVAKCKVELMSRGVVDFDFGRFSRLPFFEMSEIAEREFLHLAKRIRDVHALAFDWTAAEALGDRDLSRLVGKLWSVRTPERVRLAIQGVVESLDELAEEG